MADLDIGPWYWGMPVITRSYITMCCLTSLAITFKFITPFNLYLNFTLVLEEYQFWRLVTNFCYFDAFGVNFCFHMHFLYMYFRRLEEHYFHNRTGDFFFMILFGATIMIVAAYFLSIIFLSLPMLLYVLYVWCRRNPFEQLHILGLVPVAAPYIPYVFVVLSMVLGQSLRDDLLGIIVGHTYWFLVDIAPKVIKFEIIRTPFFIQAMFPQQMLRN